MSKTKDMPRETAASMIGVWMTVIGALAAVIGGITALVMHAKENASADLMQAITGTDAYRDVAVADDSAHMWIAIVIALIGVAAVIGGLVSVSVQRD